MAKHYNIYIGIGYYNTQRHKNMEERGIALESVTYAKIDKGTRIHGFDLNCVIEQNDKVLYCADAKKSAWSNPIEVLAPDVKASFFGLGAYKNVTITGINGKGIRSALSLSAKTSNGITCKYTGTVSVFVKTVDMAKFRKWMKEWGGKFGLKRKGDVWLTQSEWHNFVYKVLIPFMYETALKNKSIPSSGTTVFYKGACSIFDEVEEMLKTYLFNNLGFTASVYTFD